MTAPAVCPQTAAQLHTKQPAAAHALPRRLANFKAVALAAGRGEARLLLSRFMLLWQLHVSLWQPVHDASCLQAYLPPRSQLLLPLVVGSGMLHAALCSPHSVHYLLAFPLCAARPAGAAALERAAGVGAAGGAHRAGLQARC